jgi:hypothetical protein
MVRCRYCDAGYRGACVVEARPARGGAGSGADARQARGGSGVWCTRQPRAAASAQPCAGQRAGAVVSTCAPSTSERCASAVEHAASMSSRHKTVTFPVES